MKRLLIRPGAIGDFVVSLPALESLRTDYTEVWCATPNVTLARFADQAFSITGAGLDRLGVLPADDVVERLRSFDSIVSWYGSNRPEFRALIKELGLPFSFLPALPSSNVHAIDFYVSQAVQIGGRPNSRFPSLRCPEVARRFAAIHPFASNVSKRAPMEIFERIARRLERIMPVHWLRGPDEKLERALYISDLFELASWLRGARVYIGNDSGISHLAAAVQTPVVAFFRSTDPRVWAPRGPSIHVVRLTPTTPPPASP